MPCGGPTHESLAPLDDASPQATSSGAVWAQRHHGTCHASVNATGCARALTSSPPFFVRAIKPPRRTVLPERSKRGKSHWSNHWLTSKISLFTDSNHTQGGLKNRA